MSWEIVVGIITLVSFIVTVGTLLFKLSAVLTRLDVTVKDMQAANQADRKRKEAEHAEMYDTLDKHTETLQKHDHRLTILEEHDKRRERT